MRKDSKIFLFIFLTWVFALAFFTYIGIYSPYSEEKAKVSLTLTDNWFIVGETNRLVEKGEINIMTQRLQFDKQFTAASQIKEFIAGITTLTGCDQILMDISVQGQFKIVGKSMFDNELNLEYSYYKVTKLGSKYITIHVPGHGTFKTEPVLYGIEHRKPYVRIYAENFNNVSVK